MIKCLFPLLLNNPICVDALQGFNVSNVLFIKSKKYAREQPSSRYSYEIIEKRQLRAMTAENEACAEMTVLLRSKN